jgi:hypothetical protein
LNFPQEEIQAIAGAPMLIGQAPKLFVFGHLRRGCRYGSCLQSAGTTFFCA